MRTPVFVDQKEVGNEITFVDQISHQQCWFCDPSRYPITMGLAGVVLGRFKGVLMLF